MTADRRKPSASADAEVTESEDALREAFRAEVEREAFTQPGDESQHIYVVDARRAFDRARDATRAALAARPSQPADDGSALRELLPILDTMIEGQTLTGVVRAREIVRAALASENQRRDGLDV